MIRTFRELQRLQTFEERFRYLKLSGTVGESTFGFDRHLNQMLYGSQRWKQARDQVIIRDNGCDLGIFDRGIYDRIVVHHMNPITMEDVELCRDLVYDPQFLVCTTKNTHNAIHFGDEALLVKGPVVRTRDDTCPWRVTV